MEHSGFWSLLPPLFAILLAILTRQVYFSLLLGIWLGMLILSGGNPVVASFRSVEALVDVFKDPGNTRTVMFCALMGGLLVLVQRSGGVQGFVERIQKYIQSRRHADSKRTRIMIQEMAFLTGIILFIETNISSLTVGTLFRPIFDQFRISREKLAFIADSTSAPMCALIPMNAWGAFVMGLLLSNNIEHPLPVLLKALPFNFYSMLALLVVFLSNYLPAIGPMRKAEKRIASSGKVLNPGAKPMVSGDITLIRPKPGISPRTINLILPVAVLVFTVPVMLIVTGWHSAGPNEFSFFQKILQAAGRGSGSSAVLYSVLISMIVAAVSYRIQRMMGLREAMDCVLEGISGLMPLALLMVLAFAIGNVSKSLGTGLYVASVCKYWLSPILVPAMIFVVSSVISFSTGTSWGTYAIMIPIAIPVAQTVGTGFPIAVAATLSGGVFGDHCSPISDTTIISSMAAATDHIDHVRTQMPYALFAGIIATFLYVLAGWILSFS